MNVLEIYNKAIGHDCNESTLKIDISFTPEAKNLTKVEVTQLQNQCRPLSEDFPVVPGVRRDNRLKDKAISHNVNKARVTVF